MKIESIRLRNFRNFAEAEFRFPAMFTVVIGENGKGKSSLLGALRAIISDLTTRLGAPRIPSITQDDVRRVGLEPQSPTELHVKALLQQDRWLTTWQLISPHPGSILSPAPEMHLWVYIEELTRSGRTVDFPILLYFSTIRLWPKRQEVILPKSNGNRIHDGYTEALEEWRNPQGVVNWIRSNFFNAPTPGIGIENKKPLLDAIIEAISTCVPSWNDVKWDAQAEDIVGVYTDPSEEKSRLLPLSYLSDSQRITAGLAAEIAYRCVTLNGHHGREAVRQSRGVVLIDEIDLHLHPNWQRRIVGDLKKAFPNLQFIATTHSPFIVQSLDSSELINLDDENISFQPKDLSLEQVAESIMGVESPYGVENEQTEDLTVEYLGTLEQLKQGEGTEHLDRLEARISDPGLRAFLQMKRLKKGL